MKYITKRLGGIKYIKLGLIIINKINKIWTENLIDNKEIAYNW